MEDLFETVCDWLENAWDWFCESFLFPVSCLMLVAGIIFTVASGHDNGWWMSEKRMSEINSMRMELHRISPDKSEHEIGKLLVGYYGKGAVNRYNKAVTKKNERLEKERIKKEVEKVKENMNKKEVKDRQKPKRKGNNNNGYYKELN